MKAKLRIQSIESQSTLFTDQVVVNKTPPPVKVEPEKFSQPLVPVDADRMASKQIVLALDIATATGWCTATASGEWNFKAKNDETQGIRLIRFKAKLNEILTAEKITLVAFEQAFSSGKFPNQLGVELIGVMKIVCMERGVEYKSYPPTTIKKHATGNGQASKETMVLAAQKFKPSIKSNNEADAILLYRLVKEDLSI